MTVIVKEMPLHGYQITKWIAEFLDSYDIKGAEIGVFNGVLSNYLFRAHPKLHLTMVDAWTVIEKDSDAGKAGDQLVHIHPTSWVNVCGLAYQNTNFAANRRTIIREDSVVAAEQVPDESLDFVFIDADHSYYGVTRDLKAWVPKVKIDGFVSGHDFEDPLYPRWGTKRALTDFNIGKVIVGDDGCWCFPKAWIL